MCMWMQAIKGRYASFEGVLVPTNAAVYAWLEGDMGHGTWDMGHEWLRPLICFIKRTYTQAYTHTQTRSLTHIHNRNAVDIP